MTAIGTPTRIPTQGGGNGEPRLIGELHVWVVTLSTDRRPLEADDDKTDCADLGLATTQKTGSRVCEAVTRKTRVPSSSVSSVSSLETRTFMIPTLHESKSKLPDRTETRPEVDSWSSQGWLAQTPLQRIAGLAETSTALVLAVGVEGSTAGST